MNPCPPHAVADQADAVGGHQAAFENEIQRPPVVLDGLDGNLGIREIAAAGRRLGIVERIDVLIINFVAAFAVRSRVQGKHRIAGAEQGFAHHPTVDVIIIVVPVFLAAGPAVQQQHQPPRLRVRVGKLDVARHEEALRAAKNKLLFQPAVRFPLLHNAALQRNALVVIKKWQPRLEGFFADARISVGVCGAGGERRTKKELPRSTNNQRRSRKPVAWYCFCRRSTKGVMAEN